MHSSYYRLASEYYKAVGPPDAFYRSALMFLAYTPLETIPADERYALATDISLAALTGEGVFNFGEVVSYSRVRIRRRPRSCSEIGMCGLGGWGGGTIVGNVPWLKSLSCSWWVAETMNDDMHWK